MDTPNWTEQQTSPLPFILEIISGEWKAMVTKTLVDLGIPDQLMNSQKTVAELATVTGTRPDLLYRFLRAAASCQLIVEVPSSEEVSQRIFTSSEHTPSLCVGQSNYFVVKHLFASFRLQAWEHLIENLRTGKSAVDDVLGITLWDYLDTHPQENQIFNGAMTALSGWVNLPLVQAYPDFSQREVVVDVGGGQGTFLATILQENPSIQQGILFDRQQAIEGSEKIFLRAGVSDRCTCVAGNFLEDVPGGATMYIFKRVLHDWDDSHVLRILQNVRRAASSGSRVLIMEFLVPETNPPFFVTGLDLIILSEMGGKERTAQEFEQLLHQSGFTLERVIPASGTSLSIMEGIAR